MDPPSIRFRRLACRPEWQTPPNLHRDWFSSTLAVSSRCVLALVATLPPHRPAQRSGQIWRLTARLVGERAGCLVDPLTVPQPSGQTPTQRVTQSKQIPRLVSKCIEFDL